MLLYFTGCKRPSSKGILILYSRGKWVSFALSEFMTETNLRGGLWVGSPCEICAVHFYLANIICCSLCFIDVPQ